MPFRSIDAGPQELQKLGDAFDTAWTAVSAMRAINPRHVSAERERLGYIIVQLWEGEHSSELIIKAISRFMREPSTETYCGKDRVFDLED